MGRSSAPHFYDMPPALLDPVERFRRGAELNEADADTFYQGGEQGYIDYPTLNPCAA
jgi:hypothetical protein